MRVGIGAGGLDVAFGLADRVVAVPLVMSTLAANCSMRYTTVRGGRQEIAHAVGLSGGEDFGVRGEVFVFLTSLEKECVKREREEERESPSPSPQSIHPSKEAGTPGGSHARLRGRIAETTIPTTPRLPQPAVHGEGRLGGHGHRLRARRVAISPPRSISVILAESARSLNKSGREK